MHMFWRRQTYDKATPGKMNSRSVVPATVAGPMLDSSKFEARSLVDPMQKHGSSEGPAKASVWSSFEILLNTSEHGVRVSVRLACIVVYQLACNLFLRPLRVSCGSSRTELKRILLT